MFNILAIFCYGSFINYVFSKIIPVHSHTRSTIKRIMNFEYATVVSPMFHDSKIYANIFNSGDVVIEYVPELLSIK